MHPHNALIVGISGPSSSGKTTLARLLRDIFPNTFVLHEDDFYKTDAEIPLSSTLKDGDGKPVADWDCLESINLTQFQAALEHIRKHGVPPSDFVSKEDKNSVGQVDINQKVIDDLQWKAGRWMYQDVPPIALIDGFLLYSDDMKAVRDLFDVKLFLRLDYKTAKSRREARSGYVTLEGFWEDPPGYVDHVVWPNYVKDHAFLFEDGDVEGHFKPGALDHLGIRSCEKDTQADMTQCLKWAYSVVEEALEAQHR